MILQIVLELSVGSALCFYILPRALRILCQSGVLQTSAVLPDSIPPRTNSFMLAGLISVGIIVSVLWGLSSLSLSLWILVGIGAWWGTSGAGVLTGIALECLELRPLPWDHPWRELADEVQRRAGGTPLRVYYRETEDRVPYLTARGIVLPYAALQSQTYEQLQYAVAGLLFDYRQGEVKKVWLLWLGLSTVVLSACLIAAAAEQEPAQLLLYAFASVLGVCIFFVPFSVASAEKSARETYINSLLGDIRGAHPS